jgi:uncharacterized repeat protein (TIGR02543 family)
LHHKERKDKFMYGNQRTSRRKSKRILPIAVSLALVFTSLFAFPMSASAADASVDTESDLVAALDDAVSGDTVTITDDITTAGTLTVPEGVTLEVETGSTLTLDESALLTVNGTLTGTVQGVYSAGQIWGRIKYPALGINLVIDDRDILTFTESKVSFADGGHMYIGDGTTFTIPVGVTWELGENYPVNIVSGGTLEVEGTLNVGDLNSQGSLIVAAGGEVTVGGTYVNDGGTFTGGGTVTVADGATFYGLGTSNEDLNAFWGDDTAQTLIIEAGATAYLGGSGTGAGQASKHIGATDDTEARLILETGTIELKSGNITINGDVTISDTEEPYVVQDSVTIAEGATVTVPAETELIIADGAELVVDGTLDINEDATVEIESGGIVVVSSTGEILPDAEAITSSDGDLYTVTFSDWNEAVLEKQIVVSGSDATAPIDPTRSGYTFTGWDGSFTNVTSDLTVKAQYVQNYSGGGSNPAVTTVKITFNANGGTIAAIDASRNVTSGGALGTLPTPTRTGYTFAGWFTAAAGGTKISADSTVSADVTYYAHWAANTYTIKFNAWGGKLFISKAATHTQIYGSGVRIGREAYQTGFTFLGWYTQAKGGTKVTNATGDMTVYAHWAVKTYTINFKANGGKLFVNKKATHKQIYSYGLKIGRKAYRPGYIFTSWYTKAKGGSKVVKATKSMTLYAHWKKK